MRGETDNDKNKSKNNGNDNGKSNGTGNGNGNGKSNGKSWLGKFVHSHLSDDKTVAKMGHPRLLGWFGLSEDEALRSREREAFAGVCEMA